MYDWQVLAITWWNMFCDGTKSIIDKQDEKLIQRYMTVLRSLVKGV